MNSVSARLFEKAKQVIPGGVNSPVRAFRAVGGNPIFIEKGDGARLTDADGNSYTDYVCSWGPLIAGHAHPTVLKALTEAAAKGTSFGAPTAGETALAEKICALVPSVETVRLTNSGTEATMSALRLARGFTGRDGILKMTGCYHGHADHLLVKAGSGLATFGEPDSGGVPKSFAAHTYTVSYNDLTAAEALFHSAPDSIAAVIVEPVAGNMGVVPPAEGYLEGLRALCDRFGALLIFDEVITGFRLGLSGAQGRFGITPDLSCFGKIIGGGLPVGAFGGRRDIMAHLAPLGPVYQAGTLSGNPLAVAAGLAVLSILEEPGVYDRLETLGKRLGDGLFAAAKEAGIDATLNRVGSMMTLFFGKGPIADFDGAAACDTALFGRYHNAMLEKGHYLAPSAFEAAFVSLAHDEADIDRTIEAARTVLKALAE